MLFSGGAVLTEELEQRDSFLEVRLEHPERHESFARCTICRPTGCRSRV
jgi:hypothetical protein